MIEPRPGNSKPHKYEGALVHWGREVVTLQDAEASSLLIKPHTIGAGWWNLTWRENEPRTK